MSDQRQVTTSAPDITPIVDMAVNGLDSAHSQRAYRMALDDFMAWCTTQPRRRLSKALINDYRQHLIDTGKSPSSINLRMTAIRRLAREAADNNLIDDPTARAIERVKGIAQRGTRMGNWLTKDQAEQIINAPPDQYT